MKMTYLILAAVVLIGLFVVFSSKKKNATKSIDSVSAQKPQYDTIGPRETKLDENPYDGLKRLAYSTQYNQLNLPDAGDKEVLYGTLMDWDYEGKAIITLVSFKTGDVSVYFSTGAAMLGAGQHADVNEASKAFIQKAETLLPQADNKDTALTIEKGMLKFYLLTTKGKYTIKDKMENVSNHSSPLNGMFEEANKLITYIRMAEERMQQQKNKN
jgi:hypothetical protein